MSLEASNLHIISTSILKRLKILDDEERLYHAKLLQISAQRASLLQELDDNLTQSLSDARSESATAADSPSFYELASPAANMSTVDGYTKSLFFVRAQIAETHKQSDMPSPSDNLWEDYVDDNEDSHPESPIALLRSPTPTQETWRRSFVHQPSPLSRPDPMSPVPENSRLELGEQSASECEESTQVISGGSWSDDTADSVDFDSDEMAAWRLDANQSSWGEPAADVDDSDEAVAHVLSLEVLSIYDIPLSS